MAVRAAVASLPSAPTIVVERAARAFIAGYLRYVYGQAGASAIKDATAAFATQLEQHSPRVPPGLRRLHPRVLRLTVSPNAAGDVAVTAIVSDGEVVTYPVWLHLSDYRGRWLVSGLGSRP